MYLKLSGVIISGQRLEKMVNFLFQISDKVELVSRDYKDMTKLEYEAAESNGDLLRREMYYANGLTDEEIDEIYNGESWSEEEPDLSHLSEEDRQKELELWRNTRQAIENDNLNREKSFVKSEDGIKTVVNEKFKNLNCLHREVTSQTHCTLGGPVVVYTFPVSEELMAYFLKMELLTWPLKSEDDKYLVDDPAFYKDGKMVCSICSHEGYINLELNREQVKQFQALDIPYMLLEDDKEKPVFPFLNKTVRAFSMGGSISTLLGQEIYGFDMESLKEFQEFYKWFDEHVVNIRKAIKPCKKSVKEILEYLQQNYTLEPYHSEVIELQCQRHGWDELLMKPGVADSEFADVDWLKNECETLEYAIPKLEPFLYRINYHGEELLVGGEYNSDYLFADTPMMEEEFKKLVEKLDERECIFTGQGSMSEPLFGLLKEINTVRGIDEYEIYENTLFRTYIMILKYDDYKNHRLI
jgi:hypothetical protein